jgi:hypothetical protein
MTTRNSVRLSGACGLALVLLPGVSFVKEPQPATAMGATAVRDGQHDFDFEIGTWKTHLKRLLHPLTGSKTWVAYDGTTTVRKVWNGRANLVELEVDGAAGHIEALSLRLYNPESHQWNLNFSNSAGGTLAVPSVGEFNGRRAEFIDQETLGARVILVKFVISNISRTSCHFEQSYSDDGGNNWELNWVADDTLVPGGDAAISQLSPRPAATL